MPPPWQPAIRTKDRTAPDIGHVVDAKSHAAEADRQDRDHRKRGGPSAPRAIQNGQEYQQKYAAADDRCLGVSTGKAEPMRTSHRVSHSRAQPKDARLDHDVQQR